MPMTEDKRPNIGLDPVTVNPETLRIGYQYNPKKHPIGSVVWFVARTSKYGSGTPGNQYYAVDYGLVLDHYRNGVLIQMLEPVDRRVVISAHSKDPMPIKEFPSATEWRKLPKGWSWDTRLYEIRDRDFNSDELCFMAEHPFDAASPQSIIDYYNAGLLVRVQDNDHSVIDDEITNTQGYRLIKKEASFYPIVPRPYTSTIDFHQVFDSAAAAQEEVDRFNESLRNQANMSDYDWSLFQIEADIDRYAHLYGLTEHDRKCLLAKVRNLAPVEDIETRVSHGHLEWRIWNHRRWAVVEV